jgi:MFS superfamily sulfate permease-like transporter
VLGRVPGVPGYHDMRTYPDAESLPGLVIFRFDAPLIFANARVFREQIRDLARTDPPPRSIVIAAEPITDIDTTAADMLEDLDEYLDAHGTSLVLAELKTPVRTKIERYRMTHIIDEGHYFETLDEAIAAYRAQTGADWIASTARSGAADPPSSASTPEPGARVQDRP